MSRGLPEVPRDQQLALAARVLNQVLIDHARSRNAEKRGGGALRLELDPDVLAPSTTQLEFEPIHRALERLRQLSARQAEVVTLRIFAGMEMQQIADVLGVSKRSAEGDWTVARAWLRRELGPALGETAR
jgi:RNA polymerase sigma factor (TIGR02999 family)